MTGERLDRRQVLAGGLGAAIALGGPASQLMRKNAHRVVKAATSMEPAGSDLGAVEHVIFLMHENRSFDHYFGTLGSVDGFDTPSSAFQQAWPGGASSTLLPFHLDTSDSDAECTSDLDHTWKGEHLSWNNGAMDRFVSTHVSSQYEGPAFGTTTMGYYTRNDIPFYFALAQAFTICDNYFCSVLGPTHPNRLMQMTGTLDPTGAHGGPVLVTNTDNDVEFTCTWPTMPEVLEEHNISWRVYNPHGRQYTPGGGDSMVLCKNPLMYFKQYQHKRSGKLYKNAFLYHGVNVVGGAYTTPGVNRFAYDVKHNKLPAVSWIIPPVGYDEHPPAPSALGEWYTAQVLLTLLSNPTVWKKTVLFIMYDENDGFFDHVAPPTAPPGTPGEYVTRHPLPSSAGSESGPIGLGVRVPMLVVSPFSKGGYVVGGANNVFDHTSQLKFLQARWPQLPIPNLSTWRNNTVGDLTATLPKLHTPDDARPNLPAANYTLYNPPVSTQCNGIDIYELDLDQVPYPVPATQSMPTQDGTVLTRIS